MSPGKLAAQAGHAFLGAFLLHQSHETPAGLRYRELSPGTKVVLSAPSREKLLECERRLKHREQPVYRVIDEGHIHPPHFDGSPICTAIGFGPAYHHEVEFVTDDLALVP